LLISVLNASENSLPAASTMHPWLMAEELEPPDEVFGFGNWLLWLLATRATALVDRFYAEGPARPSRTYGRADGHPVPTPALVAWLILAAESGLSPDQLENRGELGGRHHKLSAMVSRAVQGQPQVFKDEWLHDLGKVCEFGEAEIQFLARGRDDDGFGPDHEALRRAIAHTLRSRPAPVAAMRTLPRDTNSFTGRDAELRDLEAAADAAALGEAVAVCGISGMAGVGKTALAVHAAHRLASRFPDGQIFLSLAGHAREQPRVDPANALASLLLAVGVDARQIPPGLEARATLWRARVAGRRVLMVIDDAIGSAQVRPLLPGAAGSLVLVTSRARLTALDDTLTISLKVLSPAEAARLIVGLAARPGLKAADPGVAELAGLCGQLPLAAGMVASRLRHHPAWSPSDVAADLAATQDRPGLLSAEDSSVAAAFELSYADLTEDQQRLFRRLGLHPGADIDTYAAAALGDVSLATAERSIEALYHQHLLDEPVRGRYRFHDLIRQYARALAAADPAAEQEAAVGRLLDYYLHTARAADHYLARRTAAGVPAAIVTPPSYAPNPRSWAEAVAWMGAEQLNLRAAVDHAAAHGLPAHAIAISAAMNGFLRSQGQRDQQRALHYVALTAAEQAGERLGQASVLTDLGDLQRVTGDYRGATASLTWALEQYREVADGLGEANARCALAAVQYLTGEYPEAVASLARALAEYRGHGDQLGEAVALDILGTVQQATGDYPAATASLTRALGLFRDLGDELGEASALNHLGIVQLTTADYQAAVASQERAGKLNHGRGDRQGEANALNNLAGVQLITRDFAAAADSVTRALALYGDIGNRHGRANALNHLGAIQLETGDDLAAEASQRQALELYREFGDAIGEAAALSDLGQVWLTRGDHPAAADNFAQATWLYRKHGDRLGEAETRNRAGALALVAAKPANARRHFRKALVIATEIGSLLEQARALDGIAQSYLREERPGEAAAPLAEATSIYRRIGLPRGQAGPASAEPG
jgi:tetratricopeptide (TPR) repeat protein